MRIVCVLREPTPTCICGPDATGEAPDYRPGCPQHGWTAVETFVPTTDEADY